METGPNATLLDASEKWVTVLDTTRLNGTIGLVHFRNLDTKERLYLQGPNGWESEVHKPLDDTLAIPDVPLCNTGTWDLVRNDTGEAVAQFNSTESEDLLGDDSTFQVDYPWYDDILYDKEYQAGKLEAYVDSDGNTGTNAYWTGDTSPPGYPATCCARVDWHVRANYEFWGGGVLSIPPITEYVLMGTNRSGAPITQSQQILGLFSRKDPTK